MRIELSHSEVYRLCVAMVNQIMIGRVKSKHHIIRAFGIPRGGISVAYMLASIRSGAYEFQVVDSAEEADIIVDDLIDSGRTMERWRGIVDPAVKPFFALLDKRDMASPFHGKWVSFPWEKGAESEGIEDNVIRILQYIGEDPERGGLKETPTRVAKAWQHWGGGYGIDVAALLKSFEDGACDEMVLVKDIPFYSHCEHHMAPFFGTATVGYIPDGKIVGLSKIPRVVDAFARRLQVQERLTMQIAGALEEHLGPIGVGVIVKARHLCMESRGVRQQGHHTVTSALRGVMKEFSPARSEFLDLAK